jgi:hypothetical protein
MSYTYTWKITSLKVKDQVNSEGATLTDAVVQTYWQVAGTDADGNKGEFSGATPFTAENVPAGTFKAFADLTEADVLAWIQNVVNNDPVYKDHIDKQIQKQIDEHNNVVREVQEAGLPWATEVVTPPTPSDAPEASANTAP